LRAGLQVYTTWGGEARPKPRKMLSVEKRKKSDRLNGEDFAGCRRGKKKERECLKEKKIRRESIAKHIGGALSHDFEEGERLRHRGKRGDRDKGGKKGEKVCCKNQKRTELQSEMIRTGGRQIR